MKAELLKPTTDDELEKYHSREEVLVTRGIEEEARGGTNAISYLKGHEVGIREVVEWLRHSGIHGHRYEGPTVCEVFEIEEEKMENQLKEWGIK